VVAACAGAPEPVKRAPEVREPPTLGTLPATYVSQSGCPGCLAATITLRPDGSFLLRDQLGASEFYDFGRWRFEQAPHRPEHGRYPGEIPVCGDLR
jgi:hypothetical protein